MEYSPISRVGYINKCTLVALCLVCGVPGILAAEESEIDSAAESIEEVFDDETGSEANEIVDPAPDDPDQSAPEPKNEWKKLEILGVEIEPGTRHDLNWTAGQSFAGSSIETPVIVIRGSRPGPVLCLTAAIHGDELNGVEIVRRVLTSVEVDDLAGTLIGVPIVNLLGFSRTSRYLPDRRDLNRFFPGYPLGSSASRIAHNFFSKVVHHCDRLVDFHTGSFKRTNLPQLRADLDQPLVHEFAERFGATSVLHSIAAPGTLRNAATTAGIPTVTFELGEPATLQLDAVLFGVKAIDTLLDKLGMVSRFSLWPEPQPIFYRSGWLRAHRGGILISNVPVGTRVKQGDVLGTVTNPITNQETEILSLYDGRLLGRALNQFVLPGFATFHIGIETVTNATADGKATEPGAEIESALENPIEILVDDELH
jgi:predicted deacylase